MKWLIRGILLGMCLMTTACTTQTGMRDQFEKGMRAYNRMLRWQEVENAGMTYIAAGQRDEFMKAAADMRKRGVTLADYRILTFECLPDKKSGDVVTEFDYFILPSNRLKSVSYRQKWVYLDDLSSWKLTSGLPAFE